MTKPHYQLLLILAFVFAWFPCLSAGNNPVPIDSVNFNRIQHKQVRRLIARQKYFGIKTFNDIIPVCYSLTDSTIYRTYQKTGLIKQDINIVWDNLIHQSPSDEFDGRIVTFGLLYSKKLNKFFYKNESYEGIEEGQILFFNLHVLGIKNLAVALEVTRMDQEQKEIEYCYVDHGSTRGTQKFILKPTSDGNTTITQITKYKCKSRLRNQKLYSFFHERIVKEFFATIKRKSEIGKAGLASGL